jgi:hypothetical protein
VLLHAKVSGSIMKMANFQGRITYGGESTDAVGTPHYQDEKSELFWGDELLVPLSDLWSRTELNQV